jgi:hypothetical protein
MQQLLDLAWDHGCSRGNLCGCRSYTHFCACGKAIDSRLEQLGAKRCAPRADINREDWKAVDAWIESAVGSLLELPLKTLVQSTGARLNLGKGKSCDRGGSMPSLIAPKSLGEMCLVALKRPTMNKIAASLSESI